MRTTIRWALALVAVAAAGCAGPSKPTTAGVGSGAGVAARDARLFPATPEGLLREMERAVLAGDIAGYMRLVDRTDPVFVKEQENWAADLGRTRPEEFSLSASREEGDGDERRVGSLTFRWRMPGKGAPRQVSFPAVLRRTAEGWRYAGEVWQVYEAERVRVMYMDPEASKLAERAAAALAEVRPKIDEAFELTGDAEFMSRTQTIKLYESMRHLQQSIYLSYTDGLGGWNEHEEAIKVLARPTSRAGELRVLLAHEYGHVATFQYGPGATDMAWWAVEGVAEMSAEPYTRGWGRTDRTVRAWARSEGLVEWEKLADFRGEGPRYATYVYTQGHHMTGWIARTWGRATLNRWLRAMATGQELETATLGVLGCTFGELDARWREALAEPAGSEGP